MKLVLMFKVRDGDEVTSRLLFKECRKNAIHYKVIESSSNKMLVRYEHSARTLPSKGFMADYSTGMNK